MSTMPLSLEINAGGAEVLNILDRLAESMGQLTTSQDSLTRGVLKFLNASDQVTTSVNKQADAANKAVSPWERLARAQKKHQEAVKTGDEHAIKHAEHQLALAENYAKRADATLARRANPAAAAMKDMIMTSRFNLGVGPLKLMPLVNRGMSAGVLPENFVDNMISKVVGGAVPGAAGSGGGGGAGVAAMALGGVGGGGGAAGGAIAAVGAATAGLAVAVIAAAAALKLLADATLKAKDYFSEYGGAQFASGGGPGDFARLAGLGAAFGKSPSQMAQEARAFGHGISGNGIAMGFAAQLGINPIGGPFGDVNYAAKLNKAYQSLSTMKDGDRAFRMADALGLDANQLGLLRNASEGGRAMALGHMASITPQQQQEAADAQIKFNIALYDTGRIALDLGSKFLPLLNQGLTATIGIVDQISNAIGMAESILSLTPFGNGGGAGSSASMLFGSTPIGQMIGWNRISGAGAAATPELDSNTKALQGLTGAVTDLTGAIGYGANAAKGAVPIGFRRLENMEAYYLNQSLGLGAIVA